MIQYAVYDTKDNDLIVAMGTISEIADYFKTSNNVISCSISRKLLKERRYRIERLEKECLLEEEKE